MVLAKSVERTLGKHGKEILRRAEEQIIKFDECGCGGQRFARQANDLVESELVMYLTTPKGKEVRGEICLIVPFECRKPVRAMEMIGSGKPLTPKVDLDKMVVSVGTPGEPYIIYDVRKEQGPGNIAGDRRYLTFEELVSWLAMNEPEPETAFLSMNSRIGKQYVGLEFDRNKNPRIAPFAEAAGLTTFTCAKAIIA
jgi:hypothetical protein